MIMPIALCFAVTVAALVILRRGPIARLLQDQPNHRSLHVQPVPRVGGLAMLAGLLAALPAGAAQQAQSLWPLAGAYLLLAVGSAIDDRASLPVGVRLLLHVGVAAGWLATIAVPPLQWLALTLLVAGAANLYNFMDGADGLAGGMSLFGFGTLGLIALCHGDPAIGLAGLCLASAAAAFLLFNWPPASVFLGDAGSIPLGFAAAALGVQGTASGVWPWATPVIAFFPFVFDAVTTLARRTLAGERIWQAHRQHLYQRAVLAGLGHRGVAIRAYLMMGLCCLLAVINSDHRTSGPLIIAILMLLGWMVSRRVRALPSPLPANKT